MHSGLALLLITVFVGCNGPDGTASTDTSSDSLSSMDQRVEFLQRYVTFRRGYSDLWEMVPDPNGLWIKWSQPAALQGNWVPIDLEFRTSFDEFDPFEPLPTEYDPDQRMFELLNLLIATKERSFQQLRAVVAETERIVGDTVGAKVTVDRYLHPEEEMCHCECRVLFEFADDDEHSCFSTYNPDTGQFGELEG